MSATGVTLRAAIIGTGRIGNLYDDQITDKQAPSFYQGDRRHAGLYVILPVNHAEAYQTTPGYTLVAAANRSEEKLRTFGERRGIRALYTDYEQMLRAEQPDVVSICTQSPDKAEITIAAAEAGVKAIVVEKAMATSMAEADAMLEACERNDVFLAVNHPYRFSPIVRETKTLIENGAIDTISAITAHARGGMLHIGTHVFDMFRYWGGDVREVYARIPGYKPDADLAAVGMLQFTSGAVGFFDHTHSDQQSLEVRGRKGYISVSPMMGDGWLHQIESTQPPEAKRQSPYRLILHPIDGRPHDMSLTQRLLVELYQTVTTGAPFVSTGRDGASALEIGLACFASHLAGEPVPLPLSDRTLRVPNR